MTRLKSLWFFAAALLLLLGLQEGRAAACTMQCQGIGTGCSRCVDIGTFTGMSCINVGSCSCRYVNTCFGATPKPKAESTRAGIFALPEAGVQPAASFELANLPIAQ